MPTYRRQHPIGPYGLDFYCARARLAVEVDGRAHETGDRPQRDQRRDAFLEAQGMTIVRIAAAEVLAALGETDDGVVRVAAAIIESSAEAPSTMLRMVPLPACAVEENSPLHDESTFGARHRRE